MANPWITDPKTKQPSVTLTLLIFFTTVLATVGMLQVFGKVNNTGPFLDLFWGCAALYLGRRHLAIAGKNYSSDDETKEN